jgi:hypothetical protein
MDMSGSFLALTCPDPGPLGVDLARGRERMLFLIPRYRRCPQCLTDGGLWQQWSKSDKTPVELRELIRQLCSAADEAMNTG